MPSRHCPREGPPWAWRVFSFSPLCLWITNKDLWSDPGWSCCCWVLRNGTQMPKYGDSEEYPGSTGDHERRGYSKQAKFCRTPGHMGQQKGSTEAQHLGGTTESSRAAECSGIASAECSLPYVAAIGAGRMGLRPQLAHMLAAHSACLKFISSVPVLQDECQGSLRAGGQRAQHSAWHTGGPQRMWSLLSPPPSLPGLPPQMASLRDEARPGFWLPNGLL